MSGPTEYPGGDKTMPLAIIGLGGRFPGDASNPDKLWNLLAEKRSARTEIPANRYSTEGFYHPHAERAGAQNFTTAHFMERDPEAFDAPFFQLHPNEVKAMDPQQRMCLEVAYEALENAGVRIEDIVASQTAVYTGCFTADYKDMMSHDTDNLPAYFPTGVAPSCLSNRVSWFYDLRGPSMTVDTACSSSLIALHLAATAVRGGEADMALVGGVNFMCSPEYNFTMSALHFLTPDGKCQSFDEKGNGYARGEGCAFIVIKPLDQALKDNDTIRAVIRNTGANQDGKTPGITLPSSDAQAALIRSTYARAGLDLAETGYFEAHGTGTAAGDPIETSALGATFGQVRPKDNPLWVGSIKANIGHLEGASGLAGLTKALYVLEKGMIPGQVWLDKVNPRVQLDAWNLALPRELTPWPYEGLRRVSINSFGFGGANAHCILDDAYHYLKTRGLTGKHNTIVNAESSGTSTPSTPASSSNDSAVSITTPFEQVDAHDPMSSMQFPFEKLSLTAPKLVALSSHEQSGIARSAELLTGYLTTKLENVPAGKHTEILSQFAYTLGPRRSVLPWKTFAVAKTLEDVSAAIAEAPKPIRSSKAPKLGFVFTGQGAQHFAMGRELWAYPVYAAAVRAADAHLHSLGCAWSVVEEFWKNQELSRINEPLLSQPLCTILQVGLVDLLRSWGITPSAVVGHSSGEIAAAYAKGAITREDAWSIAYHRGRLSSMIKDLAPGMEGGMLAAGLSEEDAQPYLQKITEGKATVACINSPVSVTISGDVTAINQVEEMLKADGLFVRKLKVETAYHSFHMEVISQQYLDSLASLKPKEEDAEAAVMVSSVTGSVIKNADLGAQYWVDNMLNTVKFGPAVDQLLAYSKTRSKRQRAGAKPYVDILAELGPAGALQGPLKQILGERKKACQITSGLVRGQDCTISILNLAGSLFQTGYNVDLAALNNTEQRDVQLLVDVPPYPWNHTNKYWCETALAAGYRFRKTPRNDLLGTIDADLNDNEKTWRHHFRLSENPWIEDHSVHNTLLYPAAGMMVMALEAAKEIADTTRSVDGYELRDVVVGKALIVPRDEEGVETKLHLRPWRLGSRTGDASWNEFMIYSRHGNDTWSLNCSGLLRVNYKQSAGSSVFIDELATKNAYHKKRYEEVKTESTTEQTAKSFYDHQRKIGLQLGITFCNLFEINKGDGQSACAVRVPDMAQTMPSKYMTKHTIHPCTLDAIIQTLLPTVEGRYESLKTAAIPTFIQKLFVSADTPSEPGVVFQTYSEAGYTGLTEAEASVFAAAEGWHKPLVVFERIRATRLASLTDNPADAEKLAGLRKITGEFVWKQDVSNMSAKDIIEYCGKEPTSWAPVLAEEMEKAALVYARRAVNSCSPDTAAALPDQLKRLYTSLQALVNGREIITAQEEKTLSEIAKHSPDGELLSKIGKVLPEILQGQAIATTVATQHDLLSKFEAAHQGTEAAKAPITNYLELMAHYKPGMKVLELGCESNAITETALNAMVKSDDTTPWFRSYTATGSSTEPVESVAKAIENYKSQVSYRQLDLSKELASQGIKDGEHDLVLVSNLSQRASIEPVLESIKKTLKPGGKIVIRDVLHKAEWYSLIFAALGDGALRQTRTESEWTTALIDAGFSGIDFKLPDTLTGLYTFVVATSPSNIEDTTPEEVVLVEADHITDEAERFSEDLEVALRQSHKVTRLSLKDTQTADLAGKACIVLAELQYPVLYNLSHDDFHTVRKICLDAASTTWITRGGTYECKNPKMALITGLARTIRQESLGIKLATLDLDPNTVVDSPANPDAVLRVLKSHSMEGVDQEYAVRSGIFMTPRVHLDKGANDLIATLNMEQQPEPGHFKQEARALTLTVGTPGMLDSLYFKDDETAQLPLQPGEIEIEVKASGLNFMDIMVAMDQIQEPAIGLECSGVVVRTGSAVTRFQQGDRVMTWLLGGFSNYARNDESMFQKIPDHMSFETAASLPMIYCTAWQSLIEEARLQKEDKVLIHAAAGGVGQAAIMIAQTVGAEIFITVGSQAKRDHVKKLYGIPDDHIFNSRDISFVDGIKRMTKGEGVDVILNSLAGEALRESWNCLAWFGRFIELGKKDITDNTGLEMGPFLRNQSFHAVNIIGTLRASVPRAAKMFQKTMDFFYGAKCAAVEPVTVMGFDQVEQGFRALQSGKNMGKIVFQAKNDAVVRAIPHKVREAEFSSDVTYVLSGGLGGLGRSLSQLLVDRGARNLAFLSRSGDSKPAAKAQVEALEAQGVRVKVCACDIGNASDMRRAVDEIQSTMPPIKGVIQAAMSLADAAYTNMTPEQWRLSVNPKAAGTWNLHNYMPKSLDFFVMLSSSSGAAGNRGQANYAAGNTFQDALAHFRRSKGMAAVAIDVGPVLGAGHVAENAELIDSLAAQGYTALREEEFLALIQAGITGVTVSGEPIPGQLVTGFATGGLVAAEGWEMPYYLEDPKMRHLVLVDVEAGSGESTDGASLSSQMATITSVAAGTDIVTAAMSQKLAKLMMVSPDDIDTNKPISTYGVDSLTAVEIRAWSFRELSSDISVFDIMSATPISTLARTIVTRSKVVSKEVIAADA